MNLKHECGWEKSLAGTAREMVAKKEAEYLIIVASKLGSHLYA